jgi:hypothetical protein
LGRGKALSAWSEPFLRLRPFRASCLVSVVSGITGGTDLC